MTVTTTQTFKVRGWELLEKLLTKLKKVKEDGEFTYENKIQGDGEDQDGMMLLKFRVKEIIQNEHGFLYRTKIDKPAKFTNADGEEAYGRTTQALEFQIYTKEPLDGFLTVFGKRTIRKRFMNKVITTLLNNNPEWYWKVQFLLTDEEEALRQMFENFKAFITEKSLTRHDDSTVSKSSFVGDMLQNSAEYKKYVIDYKGYLKAICFSYGKAGSVVWVSEKATVLSRHAEFSDNKETYLFEILRDFQKYDCLEVGSL